jgi:pilus assembly protein FimV
MVILLHSFSIRAFAMGLGDMTVNSYLDQPFNAEIELIDVGNIPLAGIKANLATAEDFERVGLERLYSLSLLSFNVEKNTHGKTVIHVSSIERISEPFMQLLVDLAWSNGQVYRSYTILLDPPNYKLRIVKKQLQNIVKRQYESQLSSGEPGVVNKSVYGQVERASADIIIDHRGEVTYGPTVNNETVWQIAQRYKTESILLQQMILAIVGTNPDAFIEGNLNGLKEGSHLRIPINSVASRVPVLLAKLEVLAHEKAWQSRQAIEHALLPPYIDSTAPKVANEQEVTALGYPISLSKIPAISEILKPTSGGESTVSRLLPLSSSLLSLEGGVAPLDHTQDQNKVVMTQPVGVKVKMDAVESFRETNLLLREQLRALQLDNKHLQQQLAKSERDLNKLRKRVFAILERQGVAGHQVLAVDNGDVWFWLLLILVVGASGGGVYWRWIRPGAGKPSIIVASCGSPSIEPIHEIEMSEPVVIVPVIEPAPAPAPEPAPAPAEEKEVEHSIEFVLNPVEPATIEDVEKPAKSKAALETLLALAKTYIDMGDIETAKQSLEEVLDFGSKTQKLEAKRLLATLGSRP